MIRSILQQRSLPTGLLGTLGYFTCKHSFEPKTTTPGPLELERLLSIMRDEQCRYVIMEVSSHALAMKRVEEIDFRVVGISNVSQDHLDFHESFEDYRDTKAHLLDLAKGQNRWAVLNLDDPSFEHFYRRLSCPHLTYSFENPNADVHLENLTIDADGSRFTLVTPLGTERVRLSLLGRFNVANALCAAATAIALGLDPLSISTGLAAQQFVSGRAEPIDVGQSFTILLDFAHTPDALAKIGAMAREICPGRLLIVFGCGGDRDPGKRPLMAEAACSHADVVVVTSDNPRSEDPLAIIEDIKPGLNHSTDTVIEPDRRKAIEHALSLCREGDLLIVAGKGHEDYQIIGRERLHFDDREVIERYLAGGRS
jgi:UDP-N-acetylmuramoyl-L-alanyl-D-glutamate--2,6-diaminopimelate ligase